MTNKEISKPFKLAAQLLELHNENTFKIRTFQNASFRIERHPEPIADLKNEDVIAIDGIGSGIQAKIVEVLERQSFKDLDLLLEKTPKGVIEMLGVKGIGPKKVQLLWKELGIENVGELLYACNENRLTSLKGFGEKTQALIKHAIEYAQSNEGKFHYAAIEPIANQLIADLHQSGLVTHVSVTGGLRRKLEIIEKAEFVVSSASASRLEEFLKEHPLLDSTSVKRTNDSITAQLGDKLPVEIFIADEADYPLTLFRTTGNENHMVELEAAYGLKIPERISDENEIYKSIGLPYFEPELREGLLEFTLLKENNLPVLLEHSDLRGILHNHTTYSDGANTLEQMAAYCKELGYEYIAICDHSKSAFYANGLQPDRIEKQHQEIDALNKKLAPFRILKGIESDILNDGSLDYEDSILASFDLVVASVHSVLRMDEAKATARLIKAIENPYTTILGHPTGRLLLARPGYPIDHRKVIDACAANQVVLELNANPYRLDVDWRWIPYALEKNVMISINPDAHRLEGFLDMHYGVCVARKGGLTKEMTFNALSLDQLEKKINNL